MDICSLRVKQCYLGRHRLTLGQCSSRVHTMHIDLAKPRMGQRKTTSLFTQGEFLRESQLQLEQ